MVKQSKSFAELDLMKVNATAYIDNFNDERINAIAATQYLLLTLGITAHKKL